jgi:hypothetical protein
MDGTSQLIEGGSRREGRARDEEEIEGQIPLERFVYRWSSRLSVSVGEGIADHTDDGGPLLLCRRWPVAVGYSISNRIFIRPVPPGEQFVDDHRAGRTLHTVRISEISPSE